MPDRFGPGLAPIFLGLALWQWIGLGLALVVSGALAEFTAIVTKRILSLRERFFGTKFSKGTSRSLRRGAGLFVFTLVWYAALPELELPSRMSSNAKLGLEALTIVAAVLIVLGLWDAVCEAIAARATHMARAEKLLVPLTRKLVRFLIFVIALLVTLGTFGVNVTGLVAGLGIGGLVVALAAKDSVENIFGSLTILFDMPFALGDWVKIDKVEGVVEEINLRSTRIRSFEDSIINLPNSNLIKASVENFGARRFRRQKVSIRFAYDSDPAVLQKFVDEMRAYVLGMDGAAKDRTVVRMNDLSETSIGVLIQCFFDAESFDAELKLREELMVKVLTLAKKLKLVFVPIPHPKEE